MCAPCASSPSSHHSGSDSDHASFPMNTQDTPRNDALYDCDLRCTSKPVKLPSLAEPDSPAVPLPHFLKKDSFDELSGLLANLPIKDIRDCCSLLSIVPEGPPGYRWWNIRLRQPATFDATGAILYPASYSTTFALGEIVRAVVEVGALALDSGLYGHIHIVDLHHLLVDFDHKTPLTPINKTVEDTEDREDTEETLDATSVEDGERSEYENIGMGVLVEGNEGRTGHNSNVANRDPDLEEFTLISNSISGLVNEGAPVAFMSSRKAIKRKAGPSTGGQKKTA